MKLNPLLVTDKQQHKAAARRMLRAGQRQRYAAVRPGGSQVAIAHGG
jgi:hypothetical protein